MLIFASSARAAEARLTTPTAARPNVHLLNFIRFLLCCLFGTWPSAFAVPAQAIIVAGNARIVPSWLCSSYLIFHHGNLFYDIRLTHCPLLKPKLLLCNLRYVTATPV